MSRLALAERVDISAEMTWTSAKYLEHLNLCRNRFYNRGKAGTKRRLQHSHFVVDTGQLGKKCTLALPASRECSIDLRPKRAKSRTEPSNGSVICVQRGCES